MFYMFFLSLVLLPMCTFGLPTHLSVASVNEQQSRSHSRLTRRTTLADTAGEFPELTALLKGNEVFRQRIAAADPELLPALTKNGQHPDFMFLGCSDSRVDEGTVFNALPGTLFTERNIANQFSSSDSNDVVTLSYAVAELGVGHVIVMGHYGCGGVTAAILDRPNGILAHAGEAIQNWIAPIRQLYLLSTRAEVVALRDSNKAKGGKTAAPDIADPGFRALVEENVKVTVVSIANNPVMLDHWSSFLTEDITSKANPLKPCYIHGFVYDISNGVITDLDITRGPPGYKVPHLSPTEVLDALT